MQRQSPKGARPASVSADSPDCPELIGNREPAVDSAASHWVQPPTDVPSRHFPFVFSLLLFATCLFILVRLPTADPDLWGHVQYGQELLEDGRLPRYATHTFTAPDQPWINHELGSEIAFGLAVNHLGTPGLNLLRLILAIALLWLLYGEARRRRASLIAIYLLLLPVCMNISLCFTIRPQLFSYIFLAVLILLLDAGTTRRDGTLAPRPQGSLLFIPPLMTVWTNTHGGFVAGWGVLVVYLACRGLEIIWRRERGCGRQVVYFGAVVLLSSLATLLNAYGPGLHGWMVRSLGHPRPEIAEWAPSYTEPEHAALLCIVLIPCLICYLLTRQRRDPTHAVLLVIAVWQTIAHVRHIPLLAVMLACWMPVHFEDLCSRLRQRWAKRSMNSGPGKPMVILSWCTLTVLALATVYCLMDIKVDKRDYPVEAFRYMDKHRLYGKLVPYFDWAQYAIAAFAPETTVAFDGRFRTCYPQQVIDIYFDFYSGNNAQRWRSPDSPPIDETRMLEFKSPDLFLLQTKSRRTQRIMEQHSDDWVLLYKDALASLWGRWTRYGNPNSPDYVPPSERDISDSTQQGSVSWPAIP